MKRRIKNKDFDKFKKRVTHKRRSKDERRRALIAAVDKTGVGYSSPKLRDVDDNGAFGYKKLSDRDFKLAQGIFSGTKSGFGFVTAEDSYGKDIFIPEGKTLGAIDGDYVEIAYRVFSSRNGEEKTEGRVRKIIRYGRESIIGTLTRSRSYMRGRHREPAFFAIVPDDPRVNVFPAVTDTAGAVCGDKVSARLIRGRAGQLECEITAVFGDAYSKEANYEAVLAECDIPVDFSEEELLQAERLAGAMLSDEGRCRLSRDVIFTMDSASALDLDDAVSLRRHGDGWLLGVHIADVSAYVPEKTALDRAVMRRGTSVYFTDKVVPMLPPCLSNGACSLNPGEDKYALSAFITLDKKGQIKGLSLSKTIIRSRLKGIYSEINEIFDGSASPATKQKYKSVIPSLMKMRELYLVLLEKSRARGALDMETDEARIVLDENGAPVDIVKCERGISERIIEQFMLTANEAVATYLSERGIPCVYRVHEHPPEDKLKDFLTYMHNLDFDVSGISADSADAGKLGILLEGAKQRGIAEPVSYALLRSMAKAKYSEKRSLHFGLGIENYCHFTSPIRRLSDLATHRIIHKVLFEGKREVLYASYAARAAAAATEAELRAIEAERRIENLYKTIYMSERIGEEYTAVICSVTSFGMFARLENTCEGLIPISDLPGMFIFDEKRLMLRRGLTSYKLGDTVTVRVEEADIIRGKLRFSLSV